MKTAIDKAMHTPGPWAAVCGGPFIKKVNSDPNGSCGDSVIAITANSFSNARFAANVASLEDRSNAFLIAAAPELLEACKMAELAIQREKLLQAERGESVAVDLGFAHSKLLAAISKAEGNA